MHELLKRLMGSGAYFNTGEGTGEGSGEGGGSEGGSTAGAGMGAFDDGGNYTGNDWRPFFTNGLDQSYHDEWNELSGRISKPSDMAKNYVESVRRAQSAVTIPKADASDDEWNQFHSKIPGFPEAPDKYEFVDPKEFELSDEDKEYREGFRPVAHRLGLNQRQLSGLEAFQYESRKAAEDAFVAKADKITSDNTKTLKSVYGPDFQRAQSQFGSAVRHYGEADFDTLKSLQLADGTFVMDHPAMFNMFARIGSQLSEDPRDPANMQSQGAEQAQMEYDRIRQEAIDRNLTPSHPDWPHQKLTELSERIHGKRSAMSGGQISNL